MGDDVTKQVDSRLLDDVPLVAVQGRNYLALPRDPQPWVIEKVIPVGGLVNIMGKPKLGKALALDTPVITPTGWRTIGDIEAGDQVLGKAHQPINVTAVSTVETNRPCYRIQFDNGDTIVADAEHLWVVEHFAINSVHTTQFLYESQLTWQIHCHDGSYVVIKSIEPVPTMPVKCLVVDAPDRLFLAGKSMIPTHNSYMGLGLACAVSDPKQTEWLGYKVVKHGPVVYIQIDTPRSFWADRLDSITQHGYDIDNIHFVDSLLAPYPFNVMEQKVIDQIKDLVVKTKPVLLIFDTLREIHEYDENDSTAMKKVLTNVVYSVRGTNTTVVFISHTRKEQNIFKGGGKPQDDLMNDGRGTSYIPGRMDVMMKLTEKQLLMKGRGLVATTLRIEQDKNCGMIVLDREREERKQHIKAVLAIPGLTKAEQAKMLADMDGISLAAAKARLHRHKENGGDEEDDGD